MKYVTKSVSYYEVFIYIIALKEGMVKMKMFGVVRVNCVVNCFSGISVRRRSNTSYIKHPRLRFMEYMMTQSITQPLLLMQQSGTSHSTDGIIFKFMQPQFDSTLDVVAKLMRSVFDLY